jgi:hypothetical protein
VGIGIPMIVVSGCPRSGTSLMMQILRAALSEDRIFGNQFPQEAKRRRSQARVLRETDAQYAYRQYAMTLDPNKDREDYKDLNPDGFWECPFTVRGISFDFDHELLLDSLLKEGSQKICKLVSGGLAQSDPRYVDRVILMARHPRAVAKSQERLKREMKMQFEDGVVRDLFEGQTVHSPEMFIESTVAVMRWLAAHLNIPVLVVSYDELVADPIRVVQGVCDFVGEGDALKGSSEVKPQLKRSYPEDQKSPYWVDAEDMYSAMLSLDYDAMWSFQVDSKRATYREHRSWMCVRCEQPMVPAHCRSCVAHAEFRDRLKAHAEKNGVPWRERPCAWEVAYRDGDLMSLEDSVHYNSWQDMAVSL